MSGGVNERKTLHLKDIIHLDTLIFIFWSLKTWTSPIFVVFMFKLPKSEVSGAKSGGSAKSDLRSLFVPSYEYATVRDEEGTSRFPAPTLSSFHPLLFSCYLTEIPSGLDIRLNIGPQGSVFVVYRYFSPLPLIFVFLPSISRFLFYYCALSCCSYTAFRLVPLLLPLLLFCLVWSRGKMARIPNPWKLSLWVESQTKVRPMPGPLTTSSWKPLPLFFGLPSKQFYPRSSFVSRWDEMTPLKLYEIE